MENKNKICCGLDRQKTNLCKVQEIWNGKFPMSDDDQPLPVTILEKTWMSAILIIEYMSLCQRLKWVFFPRQDDDNSQPKDNYNRRRCIVDFYALASLLFVFVVLCMGWTYWIFSLIAAYLVLEMIVVTTRKHFVDVYDRNSRPKSLTRSIVLLLFGYATVTLSFALFYKCLGCIVDQCGNVVLDSGSLAYFSLITIATVGYGDLQPSAIGYGRLLCSFEVASGILLVLVLLARFIALPTGRPSSTK